MKYRINMSSSCPRFHVLGRSAWVVHADLRPFFVNVCGGQAKFQQSHLQNHHFCTRQLETRNNQLTSTRQRPVVATRFPQSHNARHIPFWPVNITGVPHRCGDGADRSILLPSLVVITNVHAKNCFHHQSNSRCSDPQLASASVVLAL